jgi:UDP-3-O-acyl N-acetylglucosamine deacetylase
VRQRTIGGQVTIPGIGLQTGSRVNLTLKGAGENCGINFVRRDLPGSPSVNIMSRDDEASASAERRTMVGFGPMQIQTTEHLLAALSGLSIDNITAELDNVELPGLDGSASGYVEALKKAGIVEQDAEKPVIALKSPVWCGGKDALIVAVPDEAFRVSYTLSYPGIGTQFFSVTVDEKSFVSEIAPARTFCSEMEALELLKRGLGKGANYENTLVMGASGPVNNSLRFPDEPARHKVLDLIGDLCLAGAGLKGHFIAQKSGHRLNMELVKLIKDNYGNR